MDKALIEFVRANHGIATRGELHKMGATDKMIRTRLANGILDEVFPSVYWCRAVPKTWWSGMRAALAWASPAMGSHRSAAAALGLDGFPRTTIEITSSRRVRNGTDVTLHFVRDLSKDVARNRNGLRFTPVERTLLDLGAVCPPRKVEQGLDDALRQRLTTLERLESQLSSHARKGRGGVRTLRKLLDERLETGHSEAEFERALFRMIVRFGLPAPTRQHRIELNGHRYRFDFCYPDAMLAVEAHSYVNHSCREDWERDQARHDRATAAGWRILYVTYRRLCSQPDEVAGEIRRTLSSAQLF